jgi:hypothetical protein
MSDEQFNPSTAKRKPRRLNVSPKIWSDKFWITFATMCNSYPEFDPTSEEREDMRNTLVGFRSTGPCEICRENWRRLLQKYPLTDEALDNKTTLWNWFCDRFRDVNVKRRHLSNDQIGKYLTERLLQSDEKCPQGCFCKSKTMRYGGIALCIAGVGLLTYFYAKYRYSKGKKTWF